MTRDPLEFIVTCIAVALAIIALQAKRRPTKALTTASLLIVAPALAALVVLEAGGTNTATIHRAPPITGALLVLVVSVLGCVILRYAKRYLAGEQCYAWTAATLILLCATTLLATASSSFVLLVMSWCAAPYLAVLLMRQKSQVDESISR